MGEYVTLEDGSDVKIGTCEAMYYLRADQVEQIRGRHPGFADDSYKEWALFRFPWPDEDGVPPGHFDGGGWRERRVYGLSVPEGVDHGIVQFAHRNGYLLNAPCPEGLPADTAVNGYGARDYGNGKLFLNGYGGAVSIVAQRWWEGNLATVCQCRGCGHLYRLPTLGDAAELLEALEREATREIQTADRNGTEGNRAIAQNIIEVANRIAAGYKIGALA